MQIDIMDSYTNCMALGMQVVAAAREIKQGASLHTALQAAQYVRERVRFLFVPETLKISEKRWSHRHCLRPAGNDFKIYVRFSPWT